MNAEYSKMFEEGNTSGVCYFDFESSDILALHGIDFARFIVDQVLEIPIQKLSEFPVQVQNRLWHNEQVPELSGADFPGRRPGSTIPSNKHLPTIRGFP